MAKKLIGGIFSIAGALFIAISFIALPNVFDYENKIDTVGTITNIVRRDEDDYDVYVSYSIDGVEYESKLGGYSSTYHKGKQIDIYYDKDNPKNIGVKSLDLLFLIFPFLGVLFLIVGIVIVVKSDGKKRLLQKLKETGDLVNANYIETKVNYNYTINGRNPYNIVCTWVSPEDNKKYTFVSENLWDDPSTDIQNLNITMFPVYINPQNKNQYVVDVKAILPNAK